MNLKAAVFLDRDGTLNEDPGYLNNPDRLRLLPGVKDALQRLREAGFLLVVVTNQSGISRGKITRPQLVSIHARMDELLGFSIDRYQVCDHLPEDGCLCRKPSPELLISASRELRIDLSQSFMVGDRKIDLQAGRSAGCRGSALVRTGVGFEELRQLTPGEADFVGADLSEVASWILGQIKTQ
jgi:histidinol-phosphate phosphatase family protein